MNVRVKGTEWYLAEINIDHYLWLVVGEIVFSGLVALIGPFSISQCSSTNPLIGKYTQKLANCPKFVAVSDF